MVLASIGEHGIIFCEHGIIFCVHEHFDFLSSTSSELFEKTFGEHRANKSNWRAMSKEKTICEQRESEIN